MFQSLDLFFLVYLPVAVESLTGNVSRPQNLSVLINDFEKELSWAPPQDVGTNCTYVASSGSGRRLNLNKSSVKFDEVNNGGFLQFTVETHCADGRVSAPAVLNITYPELVRNVQCYIISSSKANCSWQASDAPDLRFFYQLTCVYNNSNITPLQECQSYICMDGKKTGCALQIATDQKIRMVFNGTVNNMPARNSFKMDLIPVRAPPLNWTVIKKRDIFNISWTPPDIYKLDKWTFTINYTECNENKTKSVKGKTSTEVTRLSHCQYRMAIVAKEQYENGETQWSDTKHFDADIDTLIFAALLIPLVFAGLAVLIFVWCRKNKENMFPKVPEPRDLLSDISDNNNKSTVRNLYIPTEEDEDCKITLVIDPQLSKPHS